MNSLTIQMEKVCAPVTLETLKGLVHELESNRGPKPLPFETLWTASTKEWMLEIFLDQNIEPEDGHYIRVMMDTVDLRNAMIVERENITYDFLVAFSTEAEVEQFLREQLTALHRQING